MRHNETFCRAAGGWFYAATAVLVGDLGIGEGSSIWYGAVVRGDDAPIRIGRRVNLQDLTIVHPGVDQPLVIEDEVTVGHRAIIHGISIGRGSLVGMGAIIMEGVRVGEGSLVAAGSVVAPGVIIPPHSLVRGVPSQIVRETTEEERQSILASAEKYEMAAASYCDQYDPSGP